MVNKRKYSGFTLLELLVVISLVAMLIGILVPSLKKAKALTKSTVCKSNLRAAAVGFRMYLDEYDDYMPPAARYPSLGINNLKPIAEFLRPFLSGPKSLRCPADSRHMRDDSDRNYFETEDSSYEYNQDIGGQRVKNTFFSKDLGFSERDIQVIYDYASFHKKKGKPGAVNYLYADGHVGDKTKQ